MENVKLNLNEFRNFIINNNKNLDLNLLLNKNLQLDAIERFKKGNKIKIKDSHKGRFTSYCNGKVTEECIRKGKNSSDPKIRKQATFAANSRTWKH